MFFDRDYTLPMIIAADLFGQQVECLVAVLKRFKQAICWTIVDISGGSIPVFVPTKSNSCQITNPSIENKKMLYPRIQEIIQKKIIKWLDVGVIFSITNSS